MKPSPKRIRVTPTSKTLLVAIPNTRQHLSSAGLETTWSPYWERRARDGDVVLVDVDASASKRGTASDVAVARKARKEEE